MAKDTWEGHTIDVRLRPAGISGGLFVTVDDDEHFSPPPHIEGFHSTTPFTITHELRTVKGAAHMQVEKFFSLTTNFPYQLEVDGREIGSGRITLEGWHKPNLAVVIFIGILTALLTIGAIVAAELFLAPGEVGE